MIVYVDTSALLKRVVVEPESPAVRDAVARHHAAGDLMAASSLAWVEVWRSLRRGGISDVDGAAAMVLSGVAEHPLSPEVLARARTVGADSLRSLDAVHLASAVALGAARILTYDDRLATSATELGLSVGPGLS